MSHLESLSGASLKPVAFGTMQWGGTADFQAARDLFDACRNAGIAHFDTAVGYTDGQAERFLGQFIGSNREDLYIATKVGYAGGASAANIADQFNRSQQQLQQDFVDLLYLHRFDPDTNLAESLEAMATLQAAGKIRHIGVSNFSAWQVMKAQSICTGLGTRIDAIQPMYNLVKRQAEVELLPMALDQGIQVIPYSPLGGGLLTGKYIAGASGRLTEDDRYAARYAPDFMHDTACSLAQVADRTGLAPATLAVAWVAANKTAPWPIISARNTDQLAPSLAAMNLDLSPDLYAEISALSPAPAPATDRLEEA